MTARRPAPPHAARQRETDTLSNASRTARELAAEAVNAVLLEGRGLTAALEALRRRPGLDERRLAAAQDLAYGVMRSHGRLRLYLQRLSNRPLQPAELLGILLVGLAELERPDAAAHAAVNEAVNAAGHRFPRARGFVNAILRGYLRRREELAASAATDPEARWNLPLWWLDRLRAQYPHAWEDIVTAQHGHPPMTLRLNRRRVDMADYLARLAAAGIVARRTGDHALTLATPLPVRQLPGFAEGLVSVQDLGAQHAAALLAAEDGMRVLDACAAPGGKTAHLLEGHALDLTALDVDAQRLARVADNLERLGLSGARLQAGDAGRPETWWDGRPFDRILLDAPCTASGVARRHPDGNWLKRPEDVHTLADRQAALLDAVWPLLRQGGKLLYATCSLFREENAAQMAAFSQRHGDAQAEPLSLPGAVQGQLLPDADHDGFYYARFVKA